MYSVLLSLHSFARWLVLLSLLYAIFLAYRGYRSDFKFSKKDNAVRHWTATIAHLQLVLGVLLYSYSPLVKTFWKNSKQGIYTTDLTFFSLLHAILMVSAVVVLTLGSALAKRRQDDRDKYGTMLRWYFFSLVLILLAIPWPFSPLTARPYFRLILP